jgi:hypothetical protein
MNKRGKGNSMNLVVKILLFIAIVFTLFSGVNEVVISTGRESLVRSVASNSVIFMKILYAVMGFGSLITGIILSIKLLKK